MSSSDRTSISPLSASADAAPNAASNPMAEHLAQRLYAELEDRRDDLIALTQDLIRIPTLNPPGEFYRDICEYLSKRLAAKGFEDRKSVV